MREPRAATPSLPAALDEHVLFRSLFTAYPDALIVVDSAGTIVQANAAAADLLRYTVDGLVGLHVDALVPDPIRHRHASYRHAYNQNPMTRPMGKQVELVAKRSDGTEVVVEIALSPLQGQGVPLTVAAIRDVGAYPRVQQAMQRARYSEFVAQLGRAAVDALDPQGLFERLPSLCAEALHVDVVRVFLLEPNRIEFRLVAGVGAVPGEEIGARVANRADTPPGYVVLQGQPVIAEEYSTERRFVVPPAYLEVGLTSGLGVPLSDRGRPIGVLSVRSREPRRFGAEELRFLESLANLLAARVQRAQSEEDLNHAQRLESVGQLTGGIAHDFNNLLTVIQGNLQMLQELPRLLDDEYWQQLVDSAARAARRGAELTSKLLAFSRRQLLQPSPVDVAQLCHSLADMLRRTVDQRIVIAVEVGRPCPPALADPGQLESALLNIAINARDAMPDGGSLSFIVGACETLPAEVHHELQDGARPDGGYLAIAVTDTGAGMPDEVKERAFEPFFTTKQSGRGTGLGLSTVYGFIKQSRGAITIHSAPGHGTTVTLYLPRLHRVAAVPDSTAPEPHTMPSGLRVLLVEDDAAVAAVARGFLEAASCQVAAASSGEQAMRLLESDPAIDLLLSDVALGAGMRGTALAEAAQRLRPQLPVLLMTGYSAEFPDASARLPMQWELLPKPFSREQLLAAIARATSGPR